MFAVPDPECFAEIHSSCYYGDQWPGIPLIRLTESGTPPASPLLGVEMSFFKRYHEAGNTPATGCTLTSASGQIAINATAWTVTVHPVVLPLDVGVWDLRIRTNDVVSGPQTRVVGTISIRT